MKKNNKFLYASALAFASLTGHVFAQSLDPTFSTDGKVITPAGGIIDQGRCTVIQPDGKILVAGYASNGSNNDFAVIRYNTDGSLDMTFDTDGIVMTDFASQDDEAYAIALQADGKIVVAGGTYNGSNMDYMVARYLTNGSPDLTFDTDGKLSTDVSGSTDFAYSLVIQPDQKIVVCGSSYNGTSDDFSVVRYDTGGALDNTFDTDGIVMLDFSNSLESAQDVALQADGKIVVAGWTGDYPSADFALARFSATGVLDNTFDTDGKKVFDIQSTHDLGQTLLIQPDGKILIAGASSPMFQPPFSSVARLNDDGSLDPAFNTTGIVTLDLFAGAGEAVSALAMQPDNKIFLGGSKGSGSGDFMLIRLQDNGSLDNGFDGDGVVTTDFGGDDVAAGMAFQNDQVVLAGYSDVAFAAARYTICSLSAGVIWSPTILTADVTGDTYQWINCNTNTAIAGATSQVFDPYGAGDYAVVVTQAGCVDTSYCVNISCAFTASVTITSTEMTADQSGAVYQWLDCDNGKTPIPGETGQTFIPSGSGNYAVEIIYNSCADTSHCDPFVCSLPIDVTITGSALTADVASAVYQWIDCDNGNAEIPGATAQTFNATTSGNYAVVVTLNGCTDTSACVEYICSVPVNVSVTDFELEADLVGATYQWLDCDLGNVIIPGATQQQFSPDHNGFFSVEVTSNGCTDTSACVQVNGLGISTPGSVSSIYVSPNPTNGILVVNLGEAVWQGSLCVMALNGQIVYQRRQFSGSSAQLDLSDLPAGIYVLELQLDGATEHIKIQKD